MSKYEAKSWVWVSDPVDCFTPAQVVKDFASGDSGKVLTEDGEDRVLTPDETKDLARLNEEVLDANVNNLINFNELTENALLHNLRIRYRRDLIYTYVSSILISVNPFKLLPIYTPEILDTYRKGGSRGKPPHIFAVADNAYNNLINDKKNQSVVISGESGAGKSEATKLILQYIAEVSSAGQNSQSGLEQQILQSNPLMESFGNAKTVRNNNSSRFGKLITIYFGQNGHIAGGSVISYLLEKSRVVYQAAGERNYHIFYQLLAGAEAQPELKRRLQLDTPSTFNYLNQSGVDKIEGVSDDADFQMIKLAMETLGINADEQMQVFKTVAAVLHLGNIQFNVELKKDSDDGSSVANMDTLQLVSSLLELDTETMGRALTSRNVGSRSIIIKGYTIKEAAAARDALAKAIYSALFDWLMKRINVALSGGQDLRSSNKSIIGVLDIFGFESFVTNSFEQLCINYCNEKLQFHFNEHIFRLEQEVYAAEGVVVPATAFKDNRPTLNLLEEKAVGVFSMIDEEINVPRGSDENFLAKLRTKHGKHESFVVPKAKVCKDDNKCFGIKHYAGDVYYNVTNFLEKNKDTLHGDLIAAVQATRSAFMEELFPKPKEEAGAAKNRGRAPGPKSSKMTLGAQFKTQLGSLMETLNSTFPHFVRCMKPNAEKKGSIFESNMMLAQLRYAGLLEVCRIRKLGFSIRRDFESFYKRFRCITQGSATNLEQLLVRLTSLGHLKEGMWAKGATKIFLKNEQAQQLEATREVSLTAVTIKIQKIARRYIVRKRYASWKKILENLRAAIVTRSLPELEQCIDMAAELPYRGVHIPVCQKARALKLRLAEENRVTSLLEGAINRRDLSGLRAAVEAADRMDPPLVNDFVVNAKRLIARIEEEVAVKTAILAAIEKRDKTKLQELLKRAEEMNLDCDERSQGEKLLKRLLEEEEVTNQLEAAIAARNLDGLVAILSKASQMGMETPVVAKGRNLQKQLEAENAAKKAVASAINQRDLSALTSALEKAAQLGLDASCIEVGQGKELKALIEKENAALAALTAASHTRQLATLNAAITTAESLRMTSIPEYANAVAVRDNLVAEDRCREQLRLATAAKDDAQLSSALAEASRLGLTGPEIDAARNASQKLGAQSAMRTQMAALLASDDLEAIKAALKAAQGNGLQGLPEAVSLQERAKLLEQERAVLGDIRAAVASNNTKQLAAAVATASAIGADRKFAAEVGNAKDQLAKLQELVKVQATLQEAIAARNIDAVRHSLDRAKALNVSDVVAQAQHALDQLEAEEQMLQWLSAALEVKDSARLQELLAQAVRSTIPADKLMPYQVVADRQKSLQSTYTALVDGCQRRDLPVLNRAIEAAIQLGIQGEELQKARGMKEELSKLEGVTNEVQAAVNTLQAKAQNELGIKEQDLEPIKAALARAGADGVPANANVMVVAKALLEKMKKQLIVQQQLKAALASKSVDDLIAAVDAAETLDIYIDDLRRAKAEIRAQVPASTRGALEAEEVDQEQLERQRNERRERAKNPKYKFHNFTSLRSPDDFAKGILLNKKKVKENMLRWQSSVINNSLVELNSAHTKLALHIHKSLLGYMGDKQMAFPATLAQDILQKGYDNSEIRDEIFLQVLKQLTGNQKAESIAKGWQMLCMCVSTFPPSAAFQDYLLNYILERETVRGAIRNYARYCCRTLEGMLNTGSTGFVPTVEEISAYKERPPMLATIELVDGTVVSEELPITPDLNVGKVADICAHFLELKDPRTSTFGLFVYDVPGEPAGLLPRTDDVPPPPYNDLPRTPRPLGVNDYLGTILVEKVRQRKNYKFVYKRKVFLSQQNGLSDDPMYKHMLYLQLEDEALITANLRFEDEEQVVTLVAISIIVNMGDDYENADVMEFMPPNWKAVYPVRIWKDKIMNRVCEADMQDEVEVLKDKLIDIVSTHPLYGAHFFHVLRNSNGPAFIAKMPKELVFAYNASGLHIYDKSLTTRFQSFPYADIYKWGGSSSQFSMNLWKTELNNTFELVVTTGQAPDMACIIMDYIQAIMAQQGSPTRR